jgi:ribonucleoside-diphosphate reductase alpha chain
MGIETFQSVQMKVRTPDGTMFVNVMEDADGKPFQIIINIGKAGSAIAAWAQALAATMSAGLQSGVKMEAFLTELSSITSSNRARTVDSTATSGPEGLWQALVRYRKIKFKELEEQLGDLLEEDDRATVNSRV